MNYRHAFHAGNFADCMKHALLVWLLRALARKPGACFVLDTHAGVGRYDLTAGPAERTGEWRAGIARLLDDPPPELADYVALVKARGLYPGSPALIRALLRPQDRLACCELHPEDHAALQHGFRHDRQVAVHRRDGWEALGALLPPAMARGLVLIDPPYEAPGEFERVAEGLRTAAARWRTGVLAAWYPIKHRAPVRGFHADLRETGGLRDVVAAELWLRAPLDPARLNGCGLVVVNPPYRFEAEARGILAALLARLGESDQGGSGVGAGFAVERLVDE
ncbi:MAG: 23S rRNA (adenine(2030)-N(6))-methyltransferase RlmJ [Rhodospirillales bacterium]|nr:23S rRNA (adenine(2030)-N(6))-methyltransferase RlmJ [Rhodospirillales bacterium]MDE2575863.1 23S rRNA (adenine(2030)-N(6))-methyltransferase RlmJ [Rhodospirillales bacterium]